MPKDLRTFLRDLEGRHPGDVLQVRREVDPQFETSAVVRKLEKAGRLPAVVFERPRGSQIPIVQSLTATLSKLAVALETDEENLLWTYMARQDQRIPPVMVSDGPVQEVVTVGDDVNLYDLPISTQCERDSGAFITPGITIVRDPDTGIRNCGCYRHMRLSRNELGMSYEKSSHLGHIHRKVEERGQPLEAVIFLGYHPAYMLGCQSKLALGVDELEVMGGLLQEPVELVKCRTIDLEVPAWAEIAIEGRILPHVRKPEGPFGEFTYYYGIERLSPVMEVTAITRRRDAYYHDLFATFPEHHLATKLARESVLYRCVQAAVPSVRRVHMPISGMCRFTGYVQIRKEFDGQGKLAALAALASDSFMKQVVVVDEDVDVSNETEVLWAVQTRVQPDQAIFFVPHATVSRLDPSCYSIWSRHEMDTMNAKWAIDATKPVEAPFEDRADVPRGVLDAIDLGDYLK